MIAVPALFSDLDQIGADQERQVAARGLGRHTGDARELAGGQRTTVHKCCQDCRASWVADEYTDHRYLIRANHFLSPS